MKRLLIFAICILMCLPLFGCNADSYSALLSAENGTIISWSQSHYILDGTKSHVMSLGDKQQNIEVDVVTEDGKINIEVTDSSGEQILFIENAETGTYPFSAKGNVTISIFCERHKGSINVHNAYS